MHRKMLHLTHLYLVTRYSRQHKSAARAGRLSVRGGGRGVGSTRVSWVSSVGEARLRVPRGEAACSRSRRSHQTKAPHVAFPRGAGRPW